MLPGVWCDVAIDELTTEGDELLVNAVGGRWGMGTSIRIGSTRTGCWGSCLHVR